MYPHVLHDKKIIICATPRGGLCSVETIVGTIRPGCNTRDPAIVHFPASNIWNEYLSLFYVRSPYCRAVSSFTFGPSIPMMRMHPNQYTFKNFLEKLASGKDIQIDDHILPQYVDCFPFDHIFKIEKDVPASIKIIKEHLNDDTIDVRFSNSHVAPKDYTIKEKVYDLTFNQIKSKFPNGKPDYHCYYDEEGYIKSLVDRIFKKDLEFYGYTFDLQSGL